MRSVLFLLAGCVHWIAPPLDVQCAGDGMVVTGTSHGASESSAVAVNGRGQVAVANGVGYSESVQCGRPTTDKEVCTVVAGRAYLAISAGYDPRGRNALIGLGYFVFVVPGLVAFLAFDHERDGIVERASNAFGEAYDECIGVRRRRPEPAPPAPREESSAPLFFCTSFADGAGVCFSKPRNCDKFRGLRGITEECAEHVGAACFVADGHTTCAPDVEACDRLRQQAQGDAIDDCHEAK